MNIQFRLHPGHALSKPVGLRQVKLVVDAVDDERRVRCAGLGIDVCDEAAALGRAGRDVRVEKVEQLLARDAA